MMRTAIFSSAAAVISLLLTCFTAQAQDFYADSLAAQEARRAAQYGANSSRCTLSDSSFSAISDSSICAISDSSFSAISGSSICAISGSSFSAISDSSICAISDSLLEEAARLDSVIQRWQESLIIDSFPVIDENWNYTSNVPDSTLIRRITEMNAFFTIPFNSTVKDYIVLYSEKNKAKISRMLALSRYYFPIFEEALDRYGMPLELKYMSIIESALNPTARSRAGARGIWQFMYQTAKLYGLKINSFVDERLDVEKAADAAARYMYDAYKALGDWNLAICSYNCGPGNVTKAIHRAGGKRDFWSIYPFLPRETRGYVPAFVGAMYAMRYASAYGIEPDVLDIPTYTDTVAVSKNLHFKQLSEKLGIPIETIRTLNPQYTHDIVPGNEGICYIKLPYLYTGHFIDREDEVYSHKADSLMSPSVLKSIREGGDGQSIRYKVKDGDYLGRIANRYGCTVEQLKKWNALKSSNIRVGQMLLIYTNGAAPRATTSTQSAASGKPGSSAQTASSATSLPQTWTGPTTDYVVQEGDSYYTIARKYPGVTYQEIMSLNGGSSRLSIGQTIRIPKKS